MTIQHSAIPDAQRHEPKGASSAVARTVYISDGAASGTWRKTNDLDIDYSVAANNKFGWNDIADALYTSGSPRAIGSGVRTQITNNGAGSQTDTSRLGAIWSTANSRFDINDLNAFYIFRMSFKCTAVAAAGTPYVVHIELQSDNGPTVISGNTQFIKGGSYVNSVSYTQGAYIGSFINNQPLKLFITPDTNVNIYDIGFVVQRTYIES
jgi:hypothetical protein